MDRYPRLFILAAVGYLLAGVAMGLGFSVGHLDPATARFTHIHLNLLGFMSMFIFGVAYHILPRFNAQPLKMPALVGMHFWFGNVGLLGMAGGSLTGGMYGTGLPHAFFVVGSILETLGIFMFAVNIIPVLMTPSAAHPAPAPAPRPRVTGDMKVTDILEKFPKLESALVESGFKTLAIPAARASFAKSTTLEQACRIHRIDLDAVTAKLNAVLEGKASAAPAPMPEKKAAETMAKGRPIRRGERPTADTLIGALLEAYPETKPVFEKNYGAGCFSCAGQAFETLSQTAGMHGMKVEQILDEINSAIDTAQK